MNKEDARIVMEMAACDMSIAEVSRHLFMNRNSITYHFDKVKRKTGLDPRRFYDLVKLLGMAKEVLASDA